MRKKTIFEIETVRFRSEREFGEWLGLRLTDILTPDNMFDFVRDPELNGGHCMIRSDMDPYYTPIFAKALFQKKMFWEMYKKMEEWQKAVLDSVFKIDSYYQIGKRCYLGEKK
ncbi:hypothetical protein J7K70_01825 [bacterium]|nr:hypothetical protein [bacterium]